MHGQWACAFLCPALAILIELVDRLESDSRPMVRVAVEGERASVNVGFRLPSRHSGETRVAGSTRTHWGKTAARHLINWGKLKKNM